MIADNINKQCNNKYIYVLNRASSNSLNKNSFDANKIKNYNEIGFSSIRGGNLVGEHTILFLGENETIEITHTAHNRNIFVEGTLQAVKFIITKKNGLYGMDNLLI